LLGGIEHHMTIMKSRIISFAWACVLLLAFVGCSNSSHNPVVIADADHRITLGSGTGAELPYEIDSATGIQLDISKVQFTANGATVQPDTVYLFDGAQNLFHLAKPINGNVILLDASSLKAVTGAPFEGFRPGHHLMLHVGRENPANPGYEHMTDDWAALIIVK
jgi:hypothetical protein